MSDPFMGEIRMVGFSFAPQGWASCNGQAVSIAQNNALFALLGVTFGGDGVTNFNLPDFQGRSPVGMGNGVGLSPIQQGDKYGNENVNILQTQMPMHTHTATSAAITVNSNGQAAIPAATTGTTQAEPGTNAVLGPIAAAGRPGTLYATTAANTTLAPFNVSVSGSVTPPAPTIGNAGGSLPLPIRNPYLGTNFIIALQGVFPSRP
jgi:microcystin-dependent protein